MEAIRFGICGLGRMGMQHCRHFTHDPQAYQLVAVCDVDAARVEAVTAQRGCFGSTDMAAFLAHPEMELVLIVTRSLEHARNAEQALSAGKTVLLEKPIGVTDDDERLLRRLVEAYPDKLYFCHNHRFEAAFANTQAILAEGLLGEAQVVKLCKHHSFMRRNDWQMRLDCGGGQLSVWGPHLLDQGLQLLGAPVRRVESHLLRILTPGDGDDHVRITLEGENGRLVEIEISNAVALPSPYCSISGDRGALSYDQDQKTIQLRHLDPAFRWPACEAESGNPLGRAMCADPELPWIEETRAVSPDTDMWEHVEIELVRHLHEALRGGIPFPVTSEQALEVLRITGIVKQQNPQFAWIG